MFIISPYLAIFTPKKPIKIKINTSNKKIETYILQTDEKKQQYPITYIFRKIISAKLNYDNYNKKLLKNIAVLQT